MSETSKVDSLFAFRLITFFDFFQDPFMDVGLATTPRKLLRALLLWAPDDQALDIVRKVPVWPLATYPQRAMLALGLDLEEQDRRRQILEKMALLRMKQYGMLDDPLFDSEPDPIWTKMEERLDEMKRACCNLPALHRAA